MAADMQGYLTRIEQHRVRDVYVGSIECDPEVGADQCGTSGGLYASVLKHVLHVRQALQGDLEAEQVKVNSLTHMVVVVDENSGESATAALEDQLQVRTRRKFLFHLDGARTPTNT